MKMPDIKVLDEAEFLARSRTKRSPSLNYYALYSSFVEGVVTDPLLMTIPIDDHLVHRGHAVFDTATVANGYVYRLDIHIDRFVTSAKLAKLKVCNKADVPFSVIPYTVEEMKDIIVKTAAISKKRNASVRYWLGAGVGDFAITPSPSAEPSFYVLVYGGTLHDDAKAREGFHEVTLKNPPLKPPLLASMKSTNYLLNALYAMEAKERGGTTGILVKNDGTIAESATSNLSIISKDGVFKTPKFGDILAGTTVRAAMDLAREEMDGASGLITDVQQTDVTLEEVMAGREVFLSGGDVHIYPLISIDGHAIGDGKVGPFTAKVMDRVQELAAAGNTKDHLKIHYEE